MPYSRGHFSKNGSLSVIWIAAYFFKKLDKSQIAKTDILSTVENILRPDFDAFTYRVLAYILLGLVKIYSKKVEYLFHDCKNVLLMAKDYALDHHVDLQNQHRCSPTSSISIPKNLELDAFDFGFAADTFCDNGILVEDINLKVKDNAGEIINGVELFEDDLTFAEDGRIWQLLSQDDIGCGGEDSCLPIWVIRTIEVNGRKFDDPHGQIFQNLPEEAKNEVELVESDKSVSFCRGVGRQAPALDLIGKETAEGNELQFHSNNLLQSVVGTLQCNAAPVTACKWNEQVFQSSIAVPTDTANLPCIAKEVATLLKAHVNVKSKFPETSAHSGKSFTFDLLSTPPIKERARISGKRKCRYDNFTVLDYWKLKQQIDGACRNDTMRKRRKYPVSLGFEITQLNSVLSLEPSISYKTPKLKSLFSLEKEVPDLPISATKTSDVVDASNEGHRRSTENHSNTEESCGTPTTGDAQSSVKQNFSVNVAYSRASDISSFSNGATAVGPQRTDTVEMTEFCSQPMIAPETPILRMQSLRPFDSPDTYALEDGYSGSRLVDKELHCGAGKMSVISCLNRSFMDNQTLRRAKLKIFLDGKSRNECAIVFYETLVLSTKGIVDVMQEEAYGDILILKSHRWNDITI